MVKGFPRHNFLAKPLSGSQSAHHSGPLTPTLTTYTRDLLQVTQSVHLQDFNCDVEPLVFSLPHFGKPAVTQWRVQPIVAGRDSHRSRKQSLAATYLA